MFDFILFAVASVLAVTFTGKFLHSVITDAIEAAWWNLPSNVAKVAHWTRYHTPGVNTGGQVEILGRGRWCHECGRKCPSNRINERRFALEQSNGGLLAFQVSVRVPSAADVICGHTTSTVGIAHVVNLLGLTTQQEDCLMGSYAGDRRDFDANGIEMDALWCEENGFNERPHLTVKTVFIHADHRKGWFA